MRKNLLSKLALTAAFILILGSAVNGQITPTNIFMSFYDDASTYNGELLAVGTIVTAYDPDGVLCGRQVVDEIGTYRYMPVYGDDVYTPSVDEGAEAGDTIRFEINGRPATAVGNVVFANQATSQVQLSASGDVILTLVNPPMDTLGTFNWTVRFEIQVRNDGEGTDFYGVDAVSSYPDYTTEPQADTAYAEPGETVTVSFDITIPLWAPGGDTVNVIDYTVYSLNDPSVEVSGEVTLYFTVTDVEDDANPNLPISFTLYQNYPNPFNPTTTIAYSLPSASKVELQIINVLGQAVEIRDLGYKSAGEHEIQYNASSLATGVYFYRIVTENSAQSRKMVLMK